MPLASPGPGHSQQEAWSFLSCSTGLGATRFPFLRLHSPTRPIPAQAPAPSESFEKSALPDQGSEGPLFDPTARCARTPRNGQPLFICHTGFQCPRPAAPRSPSSRTPAPRPGRRQRAGRACGHPCRHRMRGAFLSPRTPHHAPTSSSPPPPTTARSRGAFASSACCFRCEISASGAARPRPRPKGFTAVVISGSGVVGGWPARGGVGSRGGRDETRGKGWSFRWCGRGSSGERLPRTWTNSPRVPAGVEVV